LIVALDLTADALTEDPELAGYTGTSKTWRGALDHLRGRGIRSADVLGIVPEKARSARTTRSRKILSAMRKKFEVMSNLGPGPKEGASDKAAADTNELFHAAAEEVCCIARCRSRRPGVSRRSCRAGPRCEGSRASRRAPHRSQVEWKRVEFFWATSAPCR
jgi:hypothetical protein